MSFFAYMLRCADGSYYTGHTDALETRVAQHQAGAITGYTATRLPIALVWSEWFASREEAFAAERQVKGWSRAKKGALIAGNRASASLLGKHSRLRDGTFIETGLRQAQPLLRMNGL